MPKASRFNNPPLTKKRFERLLKKAAQPVSDKPSQDNIREIIKKGEHTTDIQF